MKPQKLTGLIDFSKHQSGIDFSVLTQTVP
jgi:hypothetical protein